ncbi:Uncharacterised protein [Yersinia frederiksenii]|nr:Uncharacterised protein [Yersinia frederiksenii]
MNIVGLFICGIYTISAVIIYSIKYCYAIQIIIIFIFNLLNLNVACATFSPPTTAND